MRCKKVGHFRLTSHISDLQFGGVSNERSYPARAGTRGTHYTHVEVEYECKWNDR